MIMIYMLQCPELRERRVKPYLDPQQQQNCDEMHTKDEIKSTMGAPSDEHPPTSSMGGGPPENTEGDILIQ